MPDVHLKDATEYPRRVAWVGPAAPTTGASITVGPGTLWVDTSSTPFVWKVRNTGDTGWDTVTGTPTAHGHIESDTTGLVADLMARVLSTDSRLSDARTPTAHATSHKVAGGDVLAGVAGGFAPLSSGLLVPTGYLGTGTADGTTFLRGDGTWAVPLSGGGGSGTVTSVALTVPSGMSVAGSPVTTSGTLAITETTQSANTVKAGPPSGGAAAPGWRAIVAADLPSTAVTPGSYTNLNATVDAQGRLTAVSNGTGGGGGASVVYTSAYSSPPATPNNGDWWLPSDSPGIAYARVSGAWVARGPIFPLTAPDDSGFAWVNQGGASTVTTKGGIFLSGPATAPHSLRIRKQATPATPWTKTFLVLPLMNPRATQSAGHVGLVFRQSSDGKLHTLSFWPPAHLGPTGGFLSSSKWTNATGFSAHYVSGTLYGDCPLFLQIGDDGTNRTCKTSSDGQNWGDAYHSIGRTDFLTADEWGFYVSAPDTTYSIGLTVLSIA